MKHQNVASGMHGTAQQTMWLAQRDGIFTAMCTRLKLSLTLHTVFSTYVGHDPSLGSVVR